MDNREAKGGKTAAVLCSLVGTLILLSVIASCLVMALPRLFGYQVYHIVSGSREPQIPIGSAIYVKETKPEEIKEGDVIAFWSKDTVVAHRVIENQVVEGRFRTKGDANAGEDMNAVEYDALVGGVAAHYPYIGGLMAVYATNAGKAYAVCFAACGAMFLVLAGRIRERSRAK